MDFVEEAHVVRCSYCGSYLYVAGRQGVLRYALPIRMAEANRARKRAVAFLKDSGHPDARPAETFLFHAPFWRIQGFAFRWVFGQRPVTGEKWSGAPPPMERVKRLLYRTLDHTLPGFSRVDLGVSSVGVRTQVLELQPLDKHHERSSLLPLEVPLAEVESVAQSLSQELLLPEEIRPEVVLHRLIGTRYSVVYVPIWYVECHDHSGSYPVLVDAVGGEGARLVDEGPQILLRIMQGEENRPLAFGRISFLPFRCPNCGWPFPFYPLSSLHLCRMCHRLWSELGGQWTEVAYSVVPPPKGKSWENPVWIPFWRFRGAIESQGTRVDTLEGLYRIAPPLRPLPMERTARRPIHFYVPAARFRNPQTLHNLASRFTLAQPEATLAAFPRGLRPRTVGGGLSEGQANQLGAMILGAMIPPMNRKTVAWLDGCHVGLSEPTIIYFPFEKANLYWQELCTGLAFQQGALSEESLDGVSA